MELALFRRMLLDVLNNNPGSFEVEKAYLATYRGGSQTSFKGVPHSRSRSVIEKLDQLFRTQGLLFGKMGKGHGTLREQRITESGAIHQKTSVLRNFPPTFETLAPQRVSKRNFLTVPRAGDTIRLFSPHQSLII